MCVLFNEERPERLVINLKMFLMHDLSRCNFLFFQAVIISAEDLKEE
jgi:hypothetical protein